MSVVFKLPHPIKVHGKNGPEDLTELKLRRPLTQDLFDIGGDTWQRIDTRDGLMMTLNAAALEKWISRLSGRPSAEIGLIDIEVAMSINIWLTGIFNRISPPEELEKNSGG